MNTHRWGLQKLSSVLKRNIDIQKQRYSEFLQAFYCGLCIKVQRSLNTFKTGREERLIIPTLALNKDKVMTKVEEGTDPFILLYCA